MIGSKRLNSFIFVWCGMPVMRVSAEGMFRCGANESVVLAGFLGIFSCSVTVFPPLLNDDAFMLVLIDFNVKHY
ncbi:hypothetical protein [Ectothiorhodospira shaposhnikovii]|uniref:hypothetical protein n=1 Tax=Ectothiorhodospira shaposhnikovii TaxID=1054 RepID=UPI001905AC1E|nr:hypothetical protein [Ectothiorhodospira shaposhnikovii]